MSSAVASIPTASSLTVKSVVVHPLVLLSVTDHYTRLSTKDTGRRVVGILLGEISGGKVDITNSYAIPFEEDPNDSVFFLDHGYHEEMFEMFKKVSAKEKVVGWYSTGPKIRPNDLAINEKIRRYTANPILVIIDVNPTSELEIPTSAYIAVENAPEEKSKSRLTFVHLPTEVGAFEAEEVGVEHLLRDLRDTTGTTIGEQTNAKLNSLRGLKKRLSEMSEYLDNVLAGKLPANPQIIYNLQDIFNLRPDLRHKELIQAFAIKTNDNLLATYISSLIRSIIALDNLINNKISNKLLEAKEKEEVPAKKEKDDEKKEAPKAADEEKEKPKE